MVLTDLDGTLLDGTGQLTAYTRETLALAADRGVLIVPATGRAFGTMPQEVRQLPFLKYAVLLNGAQILDCGAGRVLRRQCLPLPDAQALVAYLGDFPVLVDCLVEDGSGYMEDRFYRDLDHWVLTPAIREIMESSRQSVEHLGRQMAALGQPVQKIHVYTRDLDLRDRVMDRLRRDFPGVHVSCSLPGNIELTHNGATKGEALNWLCGYLGIPTAQVAAFGDERNDRTMLEYAGLGVAMANGQEEVKQAADRIAGANTGDGVAHVLRELLAL